MAVDLLLLFLHHATQLYLIVSQMNGLWHVLQMNQH